MRAITGPFGPIRSDLSRRVLLLAASWLLFLLVMIGWSAAGIDVQVADALYRLGDSSWQWRDGWITRGLIHKLGGGIVRLAGLIVLVGCLRRMGRDRPTRERRLATYLLLALSLSTVTVVILKSTVAVACPWSIGRYGGSLPLVDLFEPWPTGLERPGCFPAGHASAGYAWICLYFYHARCTPRKRWLGLAIGLGVGLLFGIGQQLRGAHFLSHDLWTLMICWSVAFALVPVLPVAAAESPARAAGDRLPLTSPRWAGLPLR